MSIGLFVDGSFIYKSYPDQIDYLKLRVHLDAKAAGLTIGSRTEMPSARSEITRLKDLQDGRSLVPRLSGPCGR